MIKTLIPTAGFLLIIQGLSEVARCVIAIKTGKWPERLADVEETEKILMRKAEKGEEIKI